MIKGNWKYVSILKEDSSFIEISDNDYLELHNDSSFYYTIKSVNKSMVGRWDYSDHTLHLHYQQPDTTRHFEIDVLTKYNLLFHEGDVQFKFIKMD